MENGANPRTGAIQEILKAVERVLFELIQRCATSTLGSSRWMA